MKCLILCTTPLQTLIAEQIITSNPEKEFDFIYIDKNISKSKKPHSYYERLAIRCNKNMFWEHEPGIKNFINYKLHIMIEGFNKKYEKIYLASIDIRNIQYIVSRNKSAEIYTFDDGIGNINHNSLFYNPAQLSILRKTIWSLLGINAFSEEIRNKSKLHYTIYPGLPNIIENTYPISLKKGKLEVPPHSNNERTLKIFLGQPLLRINSKFDESYISAILQKFSIDLYFPHPNEKLSFYKKYNFIKTDLIFEDYLLNYLEQHNDVNIEVYSLISSAIINVSKFDRVKSYYIYDPILYLRNTDFYKLAENQLGIHYIRS